MPTHIDLQDVKMNLPMTSARPPPRWRLAGTIRLTPLRQVLRKLIHSIPKRRARTTSSMLRKTTLATRRRHPQVLLILRVVGPPRASLQRRLALRRPAATFRQTM